MTFTLVNLIRPLSAFLLMTAFLLLSYCPLRRTIQNLIKGTQETEKSADGRQAGLAICQGIIDSSGSTFNVPEPKSAVNVPIFTAIVLSLFYSIRRLLPSERLVLQRKSLVAYRNAVPIYLRNRILLI